MDLLYLVAEVTDSVGFIQRIGEYVYHGAPYCVLPRPGHKIYLLKSLFSKDFPQFFIWKPVSGFYLKMGRYKIVLRRNQLFQGLWIGYYENLFIGISFKDFADSGSSLDAQGRLVITPFYVFSGNWQEEDAVSFCKIIEVCAAILGRLHSRKDYKVGIIACGV